MKRIFVACLMIGVLLLTCACGGAPETPTTEPTTEPTTVAQNDPADVLTTEPTGNRTEDNGVDNTKSTLTVEVPSDWTTVYVYTWDPEAFGTFPGSVMLQESDNIYTYQLESNTTNIIISNQDGVQTADLKVTPDVDVRMVVASDGNAAIEYPNGDGGAVPAVPEDVDVGELSNYRVVGNADWLGNWDPAFEGGRMTKIDEGLYRKEFTDVSAGCYEIKVTKDAKWGGDIGDNGNNFCFTVVETGTVIVTLNVQGDVGFISVSGTCLHEL
jgi:hypothetical protein